MVVVVVVVANVVTLANVTPRALTDAAKVGPRGYADAAKVVPSGR